MNGFGITQFAGSKANPYTPGYKQINSLPEQKKLSITLPAHPHPENAPRFGQFKAHKPQTKTQEIEDLLDRGSRKMRLAHFLEQVGDEKLNRTRTLEKEGAEYTVLVKQYEASARRARTAADEYSEDARRSLQKAEKSRHHWDLYQEDAAVSQGHARTKNAAARDYDVRAEDAKRIRRAKYRDADDYREQARIKHTDAKRLRQDGAALASTAREMLDEELRKRDQEKYQDRYTATSNKRASSVQASSTPFVFNDEGEGFFSPTVDTSSNRSFEFQRRRTAPADFNLDRATRNPDGQRKNSSLGTEGETLFSNFGKMHLEEEPESFYTQAASKTPDAPKKNLDSPMLEKPVDPQIIRSGYSSSPGWWQNTDPDINGRAPLIEKPIDAAKLEKLRSGYSSGSMGRAPDIFKEPTASSPVIEKPIDSDRLRSSGYSNLKPNEYKIDPSPKNAEKVLQPAGDSKRGTLQERMKDPKQYKYDYINAKRTLKTTILFDAIEGEYFDLATTIINRSPQLLYWQKDIAVRRGFRISVKQIFPADVVQELRSVKGREFANFFNQKMAEDAAKEKVRQENAKNTLKSNEATGTQAQSEQEKVETEIQAPLENFPLDFPAAAIVTKEDELQKTLMDDLISKGKTLSAIKVEYRKLSLKYHPNGHSALVPHEGDMRDIKFKLVNKNNKLIEDAIKDGMSAAEIESSIQRVQELLAAKLEAAKVSLKPFSRFDRTPRYKVWEADLKEQLTKGAKRCGLTAQYKFLCDQNQRDPLRLPSQFNPSATPLDVGILNIKRIILDQLYQSMLPARAKR